MASIGTLIRAIANIEGIDESSVKLISRYAREGGFISQASSGSGAARMTPTDAANLLIAVNATALAKDSVDAIRTYRPLVWESRKYIQDAQVEADREDPFRSIFRSRVTFSDAFEKLILMAVPVFRPISELEEVLNRENLQIEIEFVRPVPSVSVTIFHHDPTDDPEEVDEYFDAEKGVFLSARTLLKPDEDRTDRVRITERTILEVGKALAS